MLLTVSDNERYKRSVSLTINNISWHYRFFFNLVFLKSSTVFKRLFAYYGAISFYTVLTFFIKNSRNAKYQY